MNIFPRSPQPAKEIFVSDLRGCSDYLRLAIYSLQGLINRNQPRIFIIDKNFSHREEMNSVQNLYDYYDDNEFWFHQIIKPQYNITYMEPLSLLQMFDLSKGILYDINSIASLNIAITLVGIEERILLTPELANSLHIDDLIDLRDRFKEDLEAYRWAVENILPFCSTKTICSNPSHYFNSIDYLVANRIFSFHFDDRTMFSKGEDIYNKIFTHSEPCTPVIGVWRLKEWNLQVTEADDEVDMVKLVSQYGKFFVVTYECSNLSFHSGSQVKISSPFDKPRFIEKKNDASYLSFIISEGDNLNYQMYAQPKHWVNESRGRIPLGWEFNPLMSELMPDILTYYMYTLTSKDEPLIAVSGLGHLLINNFGKNLDSEVREDTIKKYFIILNEFTHKLNWNNIRVHDIGINKNPESSPYSSIKDINPNFLKNYCLSAEAQSGALFCDYFTRCDLNETNCAYIFDSVPIFHTVTPTNYPSTNQYTNRLLDFMKSEQKPGFYFGMVNGWQMRLDWVEDILQTINRQKKIIPVLPQQLNEMFRHFNC